ncbi:MAG TPA: hypothetical protein VNG52_05715 [Stellaceae bacterium]|nr:hypothetical protein [Stellaceae bacterium]
MRVIAAIVGARGYRRAALRTACAALALATTGCDHTDYYPATNAYYRPWNGVVQVAHHPPPAYIQLGVVVAHGSSTATEGSLTEQLKERAAGVGANVVVVTQGKTVIGHDIFGLPQYEMSGLAVRTVR